MLNMAAQSQHSVQQSDQAAPNSGSSQIPLFPSYDVE